jgi:hypothetical protein
VNRDGVISVLVAVGEGRRPETQTESTK